MKKDNYIRGNRASPKKQIYYFCARTSEDDGGETLMVIGRKIYADDGYVDSSSPFANNRALHFTGQEIDKFFNIRGEV